MLEIAKIVLPALIVMLTALYFFDRLTNEKKVKHSKAKEVEKMKTVLPLKIKAYERLIIMLERIKPNGLVMRKNTGSMTSGQLQLELLRAIREEFDHNVSLQMYVSDRVWNAVVIAKEETSQLIKVASSRVKPDASAMSLSEQIFLLEKEVGNSAIDLALKALNLEIKAALAI